MEIIYKDEYQIFKIQTKQIKDKWEKIANIYFDQKVNRYYISKFDRKRIYWEEFWKFMKKILSSCSKENHKWIKTKKFKWCKTINRLVIM